MEKINKNLIQCLRLSAKFIAFKISSKLYQYCDERVISLLPSPSFAKVYIWCCEKISISKIIEVVRICLLKADGTFCNIW